MSRILIVEDEVGISGALKDWLEDEFYVVTVMSDGQHAMAEIQAHSYDLIILDWMLPGMNGLEICKSYRAGGGKCPVLMLTAKTTMSAKEEGLDSGADDYLTKPFNMREVSARVRALLRRPKSSPQSVLENGSIRLDLNSRTVFKSAEPLRLLPKEFILLEVFLRNKGTVLSTDSIIDQAWGSYSQITHETVRSQLKSLRKKIDMPDEPSMITTVHSVGYRMEIL